MSRSEQAPPMVAPATPRPPRARRQPPRCRGRSGGWPASRSRPGVAIGPVFGAAEPPAEVDAAQHRPPTRSPPRRARLDAAIAQSRKQLGKLRARLAVLPEDSQAEIAPLIDAYLQMLGHLAAGARRAPADRGDAAQRRDRGRRGGRGDRRGDPGAAARRRPGRPPPPRRGGARDRPAADPQPDRTRRSAASPGCRAGAVLVCEELRPADAALLDPVAARRGGDRRGRGRRPYRHHAARARRAGGARRAGLAQAVRPGDTVRGGRRGGQRRGQSGAGHAGERRGAP